MKRWLALFILILLACQTTTPETTPAGPATTTNIPPTSSPLPSPVNIPTTNTPLPTQPIPTNSQTSPTATQPTATQPTATTSPPAIPAGPATTISLAPIAAGFTRLVYLTHAGDERLFVVEQPGIISIIQNGQTLTPPFLDITGRVGSEDNEQGLLSLAFHPNYASNGYFFVNYTNTQGNTVISRFQVSNDPNQANPDSEELVLTVEQPYSNHNGGLIAFGPDGYLYIGMGDGGSAGDPEERGQDQQELLGKMLRIDVNQLPYTIPAGNPFANSGNSRPEIWASGLRNPWRFSFDRFTGNLYIGDVGQGEYEEINFQPASSRGGENYGWNIMEGSHCFNDDNCNPAPFNLPITEYDHNQGDCSITGGYVYRGSRYNQLAGNYFFGDYCSGTIWSLYQLPAGQWIQNLVLQSGLIISSFGEDAAGELYLISHGSGEIYHIQP